MVTTTLCIPPSSTLFLHSGSVLLFSVQVPLLYFGLAICLIFKLFADGVKFTNIHGWDLEGSGRLFETVLERIQLGTLIPHLLLMNQCFFTQMWRTLALNVVVIIYVIVLQVFMYKNRMANLRSIMRITDKIEFQKASNIDVAYWVYRYSHPYIRVLGPRRALSFMSEHKPFEQPADASPVKSHTPKRFNIPINDNTPARASKKESLPDLNNSEKDGEDKQNESSSFRKLDSERKFGSNSKKSLPDEYGSLKLELPLQLKDDQSAKSENLFGSNSHFRKDGMLLDFAASPAWKQVERSAVEFGSFPGLNGLKVIEENKEDSQNEIDNAYNKEEIMAPRPSPFERSPTAHETDKPKQLSLVNPNPGETLKLKDMDSKPPSLLDIRTNKISSPIPLTLSRKNKSEGKYSLLSWKKMIQADKVLTEHQDDNSKDVLSVPNREAHSKFDLKDFKDQDSSNKQPIETSAKLVKSEIQ